MQETGEWGRFFPPKLSPFAYNESTAHELWPLSQDEVQSQGWKWAPDTQHADFSGTPYIPLAISQYDEKVVGTQVARKNIDNLLSGTLICEESGRSFRVVAQELPMYIEHHIPIPTRHPDVRHTNRLKQQHKSQFYNRNCSQCKTQIYTTYAPDDPEHIVCEACYRKEIY